MITMNDVDAFVRKAMEKQLYISLYDGTIVVVDKKADTNVGFEFWRGNSTLLITTSNSGQLEIGLTKRDEAILQILVEDLKQHKHAKAIELFTNFFVEDTPTIDELNDDDD